jgi:Mg2+ and Co2+ transporter CorA
VFFRDDKASIAENRSLGFLTVLATVLNLFNAVAAILAIPSPYGPRGKAFWVFWTASGFVCIVVLASLLIYSVMFNREAKYETRKAARRQKRAVQ